MYITMDEGERGELDTLLRGIRAQVHSHPELSNREFETTKLVQRHLAALGLEPVELGLPTGAAALLRGGRPGRRSVCAPISTRCPSRSRPARPTVRKTRASCTPAATTSTRRCCSARRSC